MAELQKLSSEYNPDVVGDFVGHRRSSDAITAEYARADPIYVLKTQALANRYYQYRPVKGDGNCGWRALAFGYFEVLYRATNRERIEREAARLKSYNTLLNRVGYDQDLYIDFVQETLDLLDRTAASLGRQDDDGEQKLLASFNDEGISNSIITHFRLITSAWMKSNAALYEPFLLNVSIDQYRAAHIDPYQVEIEHLGVHACIDAILKPAGIAVDVMYLDRSEGDEVNTINWEPDNPDEGGMIPKLRLLYRPGHYDILYKQEDHIDLTVRFVSTQDPTFMPLPSQFGPNDLSWLLNVPGMSMATPTPYYPNVSYEPPMDAIAPDPFPVPTHSIQQTPSSPVSDHVFRMTRYQLDVDYGQQASPHNEPCQTEAMKQAGESPAHYKNQEFQPIIWSPGNEYNKSGRDGEPHGRRPS